MMTKKEIDQYEIKRKEAILETLPERYYSADEVDGPKINAYALQFNAPTDCYRELLVSYMPILPLLKKQVRLEEADYILYAHGYARCDDLSDLVCDNLRQLASLRKKGAEIIVLGKSANAKNILNGEISNITFVGDHYAEYLGKRFGFPEMKEQYVVYDDYLRQLNIWPVDGCNNRCGFCRRSYMYIRYESQKYTFIKNQLDWYQEHEPEKMKHISLRAENLTEYGIDLYGKPMLHRIITLIDSYEAVENITLDIGMCIGEITSEILDALCKSKKITEIGLNLETASNRLLKLIGKKHTCQHAIEIFSKLREANPKIAIESTVMIGLPTETISDMYRLVNLIHTVWPDYLHINYYIHSPRAALNKYPQLTESQKEYHLKIFLNLLTSKKPRHEYKFIELHPCIYLHHHFIWGKKRKSRKFIKMKMKLDELSKLNNDFPYLMPSRTVRIMFHKNATDKKYLVRWWRTI